MRIIRLLAIVAMLLVPAVSAAADCLGPTVTYEPVDIDVVAGDVIVVRGEAFGDNCYDTGPPPEGEGDLGVPLSGIEVAILQGSTRIVVAEGSADADYRWRVEFPLPSGLEPGEADVVVTVDSPTAFVWDDTDAPLRIAAGGVDAEVRVVAFGPEGPVVPTVAELPETGFPVVVVTVVSLLVLAAGGVALRSSRVDAA